MIATVHNKMASGVSWKSKFKSKILVLAVKFAVNLSDIVMPGDKVVVVAPDKERLQLAQQSFREVKNLSFVDRSASNFPGINSYSIIFSNLIRHSLDP